MRSGMVAALIAVLVLGFVEGLGRFYPSRQTWWRLRRSHGRRAMWGMRERFESASSHRAIRIMAFVLAGLVIGWVSSASLLDKRWYEVALDVTPYVFVEVAVLRSPAILRKIAARMKVYEDEAGDDPDEVRRGGDGGPEAIAL